MENDAKKQLYYKERIIYMKNNILSQALKNARLEKNLSQRDLADLSGITQTQICRIEQGLQKPIPKTLIALTNILQVDLRKELLASGYTEETILKIYNINICSDLFAKTENLSNEDMALIQLFCQKISKLSQKDKALISLILE